MVARGLELRCKLGDIYCRRIGCDCFKYTKIEGVPGVLGKMEPEETIRKPDKSKQYFFNNDVYEWHKGVWRGSGDGNLTDGLMCGYVANGTAWEWTPIPGEPPSGPSSESLGIAARCWCAPSTEHLVMEPRLAVEFAKALDHARTAISPEGHSSKPSDRTFAEELQGIINAHCQENQSNTPDYVLANYLNSCLDAFNIATRARDHWYRMSPRPGE